MKFLIRKFLGKILPGAKAARRSGSSLEADPNELHPRTSIEDSATEDSGSGSDEESTGTSVDEEVDTGGRPRLQWLPLSLQFPGPLYLTGCSFLLRCRAKALRRLSGRGSRGRGGARRRARRYGSGDGQSSTVGDDGAGTTSAADSSSSSITDPQVAPRALLLYPVPNYSGSYCPVLWTFEPYDKPAVVWGVPIVVQGCPALCTYESVEQYMQGASTIPVPEGATVLSPTAFFATAAAADADATVDSTTNFSPPLPLRMLQ